MKIKNWFMTLMMILLSSTAVIASDLKSSVKDELATPNSWPAGEIIDGINVRLKINQIK